jgi:hypothetical protein
MNAFNRAMIEDMARRWGAQVDYVPDSILNAVGPRGERTGRPGGRRHAALGWGGSH